MGKIVTVNFRGDQLFGFEADDGIYVALKPIVEAMGIDWSSQLKRVKRDPILSEGMVIMTTPFGRGGDQEAVCLKLELINGWLFTIESNRIKDETVRERVLMYQRECYSVLARHFVGGVETVKPELANDASEAEGTRVRMVTETRQTFGTKAAGQLWFKLGLPVVPAMLENPDQAELFDFAKIKTIDGATA
jgi:hypothetical protein